MLEAIGKGGALVRLAGVHKRYRNGAFDVHALHDIHVEVEPGDMVAVCGPAGHGKTTLLNLVGLLDTASEGEVVVGGTDVSTLSAQARADLRHAHIGWIFQHASLVPVMTAQQNVLLPLLLAGFSNQSELELARALAAELLARLGLATQVHQYPGRLDPSQCQRVAIARAFMAKPWLVVADEPTSRLDSGSVRLVIELMSAWQREHGTAFVVSTRDQRQLVRSARVLHLSEGRLLDVPADTPRRDLRAMA